MKRQKRWNAYIMAGRLKIYLRKAMTTNEAVKWLQEKCKIVGTNYFMCGVQVLCEYK
jgi:hypothetical protein